MRHPRVSTALAVATRWLVAAGAALMLAGCGNGLSLPQAVELPAEVQFVLDNVGSFLAMRDDPLAAVEPGTVRDDPNELTGCWGTVLRDSAAGSPVVMYVIYRFDGQTGQYIRWSFAGLESGQLWPLMPLIAAHSGSFDAQSGSVLRMTLARGFANIDPQTGEITSDVREQPPSGGLAERKAVVTLAGDRMLLIIDRESPEQVEDTDRRAVFRRFECPAAE